MLKILVLGSINIDHSYEVNRIVRPGETIASTAYRTAWGGKGLNQAIALAKAGAKTGLAAQWTSQCWMSSVPPSALILPK